MPVISLFTSKLILGFAFGLVLHLPGHNIHLKAGHNVSVREVCENLQQEFGIWVFI